MKHPVPTTWCSTCPCGKRGFQTRRDAKAAARRAFPGDCQSAYQCPVSGLHHYGHLNKGVVLGRFSR